MAGKIEVTVNKNNNQVILTQNTTNVVEVHTLGPQGAVGATGATGPQHDPNSITGSLHLTGSLIVSSSYVDFTNATAISGSTFSGSFVGDGSGITGVTAEWDGSHNGNAEITGSLTTTSYINATHYYLSNVSNVLYGTPTNKLIIGDETTQWPIIDIGRLGTNSQQIRIYGQITASGNISSSATVSGLTGSFGRLEGLSTITAVGNISSSAYIYGTHLYFNNKIALYEGALGLYMADNTTDWPSIIIGRSGTNSQNIQMHGQITASGTITAVGNISSSAYIYGSELHSDGKIMTRGSTTINNNGTTTYFGITSNKTEIDGTNISLNGPVTASGNISASGDSNYLGGSLTLTSTANSIFTIIDGDGDEQHVLKGRGNVNSYLAMGAASNLGIGTSTPSQKLTVTGNISSSGTVTANAFVGGGSGITGVVSSSYAVTASYALSSAGGGGGSGIFNQTGSYYTTTNDLQITGSLAVTTTMYIGSSPSSLYDTAQIASTTATTQSVYSISTSSYDAAFFDYVVTSASNMRAGNIMSVWDASSNLNYTETTTTDIGDTSNIQLLVNISASRAHLHTVCSSASWKIKTIIKSI